MDTIAVPDDVPELIASKIERNIRELEGALIRVTAFASLNNTELDKSLAEVVLNPTAQFGVVGDQRREHPAITAGTSTSPSTSCAGRRRPARSPMPGRSRCICAGS